MELARLAAAGSPFTAEASGLTVSPMRVDGYLADARHADDPDDDGRRCPRCGERNDPGYRYCGTCVARIR